MFKKLVSNLPYNPSLIGQVSFYGRRLKKENAIRRAGAVLTVLTMLIQMFAVISPAKPTLAASENDVVLGGVSSMQDLLGEYDRNTRGIQSLYGAFNVGRDEIAAATYVPKNDDAAVNSAASNNFYSVGRHTTGSDVATYRDTIGNTWYLRPLNAATSGRSVDFGSYKGTSKTGQTFWILADCANMTIKGPGITGQPAPTPVTPAPVTPAPVTPAPVTPTSSGANAQVNWGCENDITVVTVTGSGVRNIDQVVDNTYPEPFGYNGSLPSSFRIGGGHTFKVTVYANDGSTLVSGQTFTTDCKAPVVTTTTPTPTTPVVVTTTYYCGDGTVGAGQPAPGNNPSNCVRVVVCPAGTIGAGQPAPNNAAANCAAVVICPTGTVGAGQAAPGNNPSNCAATKPLVEIIKDNTPKGDVIAGQEITYRVQFRNVGNAPAVRVKVTDTLPASVEYVRHTANSGTVTVDGQTLTFTPSTTDGVMGVSATYQMMEIVARVRNNASAGSLCNKSRITADAVDVTSNEVCNTVKDKPKECPYKAGSGVLESDKENCRPCPTLTNSTVSFDSAQCPKPLAACSYIEQLPFANTTVKTRKFKSVADVQNTAVISGFNYDFNDGTALVKSNTSKSMEEVEHTFAKAGVYKVRVTVRTSAGEKTNDTTCVETVIVEDAKAAVLVLNKKVKNNTQGIADANDTTANAGDELEYHLITQNLGGTDALNMTLEAENLADVKFYADIVSIGDGVYADNTKNVVSWPTQTIKAGETITKIITVKVKNPVPKTAVNTDSTRSLDYDNVMTNKYGPVSVNVKLPQSVAQRLQGVNTKLPNTGPGMSLVLGFTATTVVAYFLARGRLLAKELVLIRNQYIAGGY
jgi:uncharacterized repeat protein (TIGR01451 family)